MPITLPELNDPEKEAILADIVDLTNQRKRLINPDHVDFTPETFLQDVVDRYLEGCVPALAEEKALRSMHDPLAVRTRLLK